LALCMNAQAGWFGTGCTDVMGDVKMTETKMGITLSTTKFDEVLGQTSQDVWDSSQDNWDLISYSENEKHVVESSSAQDCMEDDGDTEDGGMMAYYETETYVAKMEFYFTDGRLFPVGTYNASTDLKKISVPMLCKYEAGGATFSEDCKKAK
jgi:hypothetical protein